MSQPNAGRLLYPLRVLQDDLALYLRRHVQPGDVRGYLIVDTILPTLRRCTILARELTPFDPSGL